MDLKVRCRYIYNKYYKFVLYDLWEWVGKSFSTYEQTYFERYIPTTLLQIKNHMNRF